MRRRSAPPPGSSRRQRRVSGYAHHCAESLIAKHRRHLRVRKVRDRLTRFIKVLIGRIPDDTEDLETRGLPVVPVHHEITPDRRLVAELRPRQRSIDDRDTWAAIAIARREITPGNEGGTDSAT